MRQAQTLTDSALSQHLNQHPGFPRKLWAFNTITHSLHLADSLPPPQSGHHYGRPLEARFCPAQRGDSSRGAYTQGLENHSSQIPEPIGLGQYLGTDPLLHPPGTDGYLLFYPTKKHRRLFQRGPTHSLVGGRIGVFLAPRSVPSLSWPSQPRLLPWIGPTSSST